MTVQELYESIGGSYESAKRVMQSDRLIAKFIVKFTADKSFDTLEHGWAARDAKETFEGAHTLKGVCANLGLDAMSVEASELAEQFRPGSERTLGDAAVSERIAALRTQRETAVRLIREFAEQG